MMRCTAVLLAVLSWSPIVVADGVYLSESIGGTAYQGGLKAYGTGGPRLSISIGYRRDPAWAVEAVIGAIVPDMFYIDCYGDECGEDPRAGAYGFGGVDIKRRWPLAHSRWPGLAVRATLHAGPRVFIGTDALTGYDGIGLNAGASLEADLWVIGYFLDFGIDAMWMAMPVDHMRATAPYVMFGGKVGWL
jgi:hypothetical protein